jgi:hypothetical protein
MAVNTELYFLCPSSLFKDKVRPSETTIFLKQKTAHWLEDLHCGKSGKLELHSKWDSAEYGVCYAVCLFT